MTQAPTPEQVRLAAAARERGVVAVLGVAGSDPSCSPGVVRVSGPDAASFLHSQLTNDVVGLAPGEGNATARVRRTGHLVEILSLHRLPDEMAVAGDGCRAGADSRGAPDGGAARFLLFLEGPRVPRFLEDLERFHFSEDARLEDVSGEWGWTLLTGACVAPMLPLLVAGGRDLPPWGVAAGSETTLPAGSIVVDRPLGGERGLLVGVPRGAG